MTDLTTYCLFLAILVIVYLEFESRMWRRKLQASNEYFRKLSGHGLEVLRLSLKVQTDNQHFTSALKSSVEVFDEIMNRAVPFIDDPNDKESVEEFHTFIKGYYFAWRKIHPFGYKNEL